MAVVRLRRPSGLDRLLTAVCDAVDAALSEVLPSVIREGTELRESVDANGKKIDGIVFAAGVALAVEHKLGRAPSRWWVTRDFGASASNLRETTIPGSSPPVTRDSKRIGLISTTACTVYLWVS